jgi:hypothetical protein
MKYHSKNHLKLKNSFKSFKVRYNKRDHNKKSTILNDMPKLTTKLTAGEKLQLLEEIKAMLLTTESFTKVEAN